MAIVRYVKVNYSWVFRMQLFDFELKCQVHLISMLVRIELYIIPCIANILISSISFIWTQDENWLQQTTVVL